MAKEKGAAAEEANKLAAEFSNFYHGTETNL
jgi:hypothetical protein